MRRYCPRERERDKGRERERDERRETFSFYHTSTSHKMSNLQQAPQVLIRSKLDRSVGHCAEQVGTEPPEERVVALVLDDRPKTMQAARVRLLRARRALKLHPPPDRIERIGSGLRRAPFRFIISSKLAQRIITTTTTTTTKCINAFHTGTATIAEPAE